MRASLYHFRHFWSKVARGTSIPFGVIKPVHSSSISYTALEIRSANSDYETPPTATGAPSRAHEGPLSAVMVDIVTAIIAMTVVVVFYDGYPILLRYSILGDATCQWGIVYDLLWVL